MATYYVNGSTGSDSYTSTQAQNPSTPWKTLDHAYNNMTPASDTLVVNNAQLTGPFLLDTGGNEAAAGIIPSSGLSSGLLSPGPAILDDASALHISGILDFNTGDYFPYGIIDSGGNAHTAGGYLTPTGAFIGTPGGAPYFAQYTDLNNRYGQFNVNVMADQDGTSVGPSDNGNTATEVGARINLGLLNSDAWIRGFLRKSRYSGLLPNLVDRYGNIPLELTQCAVMYTGWILLCAAGTRDFDQAGKPMNHLYADFQMAEQYMRLIAEGTTYLLDVQGTQ